MDRRRYEFELEVLSRLRKEYDGAAVNDAMFHSGLSSQIQMLPEVGTLDEEMARAREGPPGARRP